MLQSSGPVNWEVAEQIADFVALGGGVEQTIEPAAGIQLEQLARAAQTLVVGETGLTATFRAPVRTVGPKAWAELHLVALRPVLEALASRLGGAMQVEVETPTDEEPAGDPFAALVPAMAPLLLGLQAGSMIGHLARHALGRYDLPLPTDDEPSLCFVVANLDAFEREWALPREDLRFYVAIHEVVHAAERSVPWVRKRLVDLATEYVSSYEVDVDEFEARFGDIDPLDLSSIRSLAERPEMLLGAMQSDRQRAVLTRLQALTTALEGYADTVLERVSEPLIPSFARIHEAMQRHRIERGEAERFIEALLGLKLDRADYERGQTFCRGVIERAGLDGLNRLWEHEGMIPTPAELDAPGLWLARIELDLPEQA